MADTTKFEEYKVVVCGPGGAGKSCLTNMLVVGLFTEEYDPTIEDSYRKQVSVDSEDAVLDILDTAGQEEYSSMLDEYLRKGQGFLLVYSITSRESFEEIPGFMEKMLRAKDSRQVPTVLVGNKKDLDIKREVSFEEGADLARTLGAAFLEASAKNNDGVEEAFYTLIREVRKDRDAKGYTLNQVNAPGKEMTSKLKNKFSKWGFGRVLRNIFKKKKKNTSPAPSNNKSSPTPTTTTPTNTNNNNNNSSVGGSTANFGVAQPQQQQPNHQQQQPAQNTNNFGHAGSMASPNTQAGTGNAGGVGMQSSGTTPSYSSNHSASHSEDDSNASYSQGGYGQENGYQQQQQQYEAQQYQQQQQQQQYGQGDTQKAAHADEVWFYGSISSTDADALLEPVEAGTFLVRESAQPGCFAVSWKAEDGMVRKSLIISDPNTGFYFSDVPQYVYGTLSELVSASSHVLQTPLPKQQQQQQQNPFGGAGPSQNPFGGQGGGQLPQAPAQDYQQNSYGGGQQQQQYGGQQQQQPQYSQGGGQLPQAPAQDYQQNSYGGGQQQQQQQQYGQQQPQYGQGGGQLPQAPAQDYQQQFNNVNQQMSQMNMGGGEVMTTSANGKQIMVGQRVRWVGQYMGTVRFFGEGSFARGMWVGIELDEPCGKNDGSVKGQSYFQCQPNHGIFTNPNKVEVLE